ncbi:Nucleoside diphosphate kinase 7 [Liparis tanakae]|uniref:Nucleoside diphosphate kinase B n=1 Tax=Liparis tanakae TaxID=230148 RepID=A0A4Z2DZW1_9TELE|nr:Nucleoside diphosphate kinase 7 [Liparis tanakae]
MGSEAVSVWRTLLGPADSSAARKEAPLSVRAQFGTDSLKNVGHGSESLAAAARELEFFFPSTAGHGPANTAEYGDCTCCIIKPHALAAGTGAEGSTGDLRGPQGTSEVHWRRVPGPTIPSMHCKLHT